MYRFGRASRERLSTCHSSLQEIFNEVIKIIDCSILVGHRGQEEQTQAFISKKSKLAWPNSKHNKTPSLAVDVAPYPIDWNDRGRFYFFAGVVKGVAASKGIKIRWGGDWDGDNDFKDQTFDDLVHFELVEEDDSA